MRDVGDLEWSILPLLDVLLAVAERFGSQNVAVIGHSLGAKGAVDALLAAGETTSDRVVGQSILTAPDIDAEVFVRDFPKLSALVSSTTLYTSEQDRALKASRNVHDAPRLGDGTVDLSRFRELDVVEVVQRHWWWNSGHQYHLSSPAVVADLREMLAGSSRLPGRRTIYAKRH